MNYEPYLGYWFYGAATSDERASYFSSWGLIDAAPSTITYRQITTWFWNRFTKVVKGE